MSRNNAAYDFSLFETKEEKKEVKNNVVKIKLEKKRLNLLNLKNASLLFSSLVSVSLIACMIQGQVELTELTEKSNSLKKEIEVSVGEYTQLTLKEDSKTSLKEIEEKAKENGMERINTKNIEYVTMPIKDKAEIKVTDNENLQEKIKNIISLE